MSSPNTWNGSWRKQATNSGVVRCSGLLSDQLLARVRAGLDPDPDSVIPESPTICTGVPLHLRPRRPRRRRWLRGRPRRWWSPTGRAAVAVVPVMAVIPVPVVAPAIVPAVARAPVMVIHRCRSRRRLGCAGGQSERGQSHAAGRQRTRAQAKPLSSLRCLRFCIHASASSRRNAASNVSSQPHTRCLTATQLTLTLRRAPGQMVSRRAGC
jgi:hypothetical protein